MSDKQKSLVEFWRAFAWTVLYVLVVYAIMRGLFSFNIFSVAHLAKLRHLELHSLPGFVFGILVLAAVPLYVATTVLTVRNKDFPIKIPLPKCFTETTPVVVPQSVAPLVTEQEPLPELPVGVPAEMRETFMRAKKNYGARQMSVFNRPNASTTQTGQIKPEPITESVSAGAVEDVAEYGGMPIPSDFDIDTSASNSDVPVFADINFDDDDDSKEISEINPKTENSSVCEKLCAAGVDAKLCDDLIVAGNFAIAVHDDDDFWVPDDTDWFAAGKQKPSPIAALKKAQSEQNLQPIFYLRSGAIMDNEKYFAQWTADGITIVTEEKDLLNIVGSV